MLDDGRNNASRTLIVVIVVVVVIMDRSSVRFNICMVLLQISLFNQLLDGTPEGKALFDGVPHIAMKGTISR